MDNGKFSPYAFWWFCSLSGLITFSSLSCSRYTDRWTTYEEDQVGVFFTDQNGKEQELKVLWWGNIGSPRLIVIQSGPKGMPDPAITGRETMKMEVGGRRVFRRGSTCLVIVESPNGVQQFSIPSSTASSFVQTIGNGELDGGELAEKVFTFVESESQQGNVTPCPKGEMKPMSESDRGAATERTSKD